MTAGISDLFLPLNSTHISARLADMAKLPRNETIRPHRIAVGPPDGSAMDNEVAIATHEFRIAYASPTFRSAHYPLSKSQIRLT